MKLTKIEKQIIKETGKDYISIIGRKNTHRDTILKDLDADFDDYSLSIMFEFLAGYASDKFGDNVDKLRDKLWVYKFGKKKDEKQ